MTNNVTERKNMLTMDQHSVMSLIFSPNPFPPTRDEMKAIKRIMEKNPEWFNYENGLILELSDQGKKEIRKMELIIMIYQCYKEKKLVDMKEIMDMNSLGFKSLVVTREKKFNITPGQVKKIDGGIRIVVKKNKFIQIKLSEER